MGKCADHRLVPDRDVVVDDHKPLHPRQARHHAADPHIRARRHHGRGQVADIDTYTFDLWLYVERLATDDQTISTADDFIGLILAAFSQGITLGNAGSTRSALIRGGRANEWVKIGGSEYMRVGFHLEVSARPARNRTA